MGKKVNPLNFRLDITQKHQSNWFSDFSKYSSFLKRDRQIRILIIWLLKYIEEHEKKHIFDLHNINIERSCNNKKLIIQIKIVDNIILKQLFDKYFVRYSSLLYEIKKLNFDCKFFIRFINITSSFINPNFILNLLISKVDKRITFRRSLQVVIQEFNKLANEILINNKSLIKNFGLLIKISGRIGGSDIASSLKVKEGIISLQTLKSNVLYKFEQLNTIFGLIGIKVWVSNTFIN